MDWKLLGEIAHWIVPTITGIIGAWIAVASTRRTGRREREESFEKAVVAIVDRHQNKCVLQDALTSAIGARKAEVKAQLDDLRREVGESMEGVVKTHALLCPYGETIARAMDKVRVENTAQIERERQEREKGRNENRDRIVEMSERLSDGQRELHEGQKEIAKQLGTVVIAVTEIRGHMETMDSQRDTLASEVERIRDKQNGHAVRRTMGEE